MSSERSLAWKPKSRKYDAEKKLILKSPQPCAHDPLKAVGSSLNESNDSVRNNPLSPKISEQAFVDPLNQALDVSPTSEDAFSLSKIVANVSFKEKVILNLNSLLLLF